MVVVVAGLDGGELRAEVGAGSEWLKRGGRGDGLGRFEAPSRATYTPRLSPQPTSISHGQRTYSISSRSLSSDSPQHGISRSEYAKKRDAQDLVAEQKKLNDYLALVEQTMQKVRAQIFMRPHL